MTAKCCGRRRNFRRWEDGEKSPRGKQNKHMEKPLHSQIRRKRDEVKCQET